MAIGENSRDAAASAADGTRPAEAVNLIRCGGRHTARLHAIQLGHLYHIVMLGLVPGIHVFKRRNAKT
jgi:hypothetical protein